MDTRPVDVEMLVQLLEQLRENAFTADEMVLTGLHERIGALETVVLLGLRVIQHRLQAAGPDGAGCA